MSCRFGGGKLRGGQSRDWRTKEGLVDDEGDEVFAELFGLAQGEMLECHLGEFGEVGGEGLDVFAVFEAEEFAQAQAMGGVGGVACGEEAEGDGRVMSDG